MFDPHPFFGNELTRFLRKRAGYMGFSFATDLTFETKPRPDFKILTALIFVKQHAKPLGSQVDTSS